MREELLNCGTVLQISDLPDDGFSDQDIKKIVQPFGKVSDLIVLRSRNEVSFPVEGVCARMQKKLSNDKSCSTCKLSLSFWIRLPEQVVIKNHISNLEIAGSLNSMLLPEP